MYQKPTLSAWEYVTLLGALSRITLALLGASLKAVLPGSNKASTYRKHVTYAAIRALTENTTLRHSQALSPSTLEVYKAFAKKEGFEPEVVKIAEDTEGCWIGDKNADTVVIWFHGGGYALMASANHMTLISNFREKAAATGATVAAFILQYDLAPQATYPRQLQQAAAAIAYLTNDLGKSYSQLIVSGDSAGGNLALALLSHMAHPHPRISKLQSSGQVFKGVLLVSPWVTFDQSAKAFETNAQKDCLSSLSLRKWSDAFLGGAATDNYNTPLLAPVEWWQNLPAAKVLILTGEDELFVDDIREFAAKLKDKNTQNVELVVAPGECHDAPIIEGIYGTGDCEQTKRLYYWVSNEI